MLGLVIFFGSKDILSSIYPSGYKVYIKYQAQSSGTALQIFIYLAKNCSVKVALYSDSANSPGTLLFQDERTGGFGWNIVELSVPITSGEYYWVGFACSVSSLRGVSSGGSNLYASSDYANDFVSNPTSLSTGTWSSISIYVAGSDGVSGVADSLGLWGSNGPVVWHSETSGLGYWYAGGIYSDYKAAEAASGNPFYAYAQQ